MLSRRGAFAHLPVQVETPVTNLTRRLPSWSSCNVDHVLSRAELFDEQPHGFDMRLLRDGKFFASRRFVNRDVAVDWQTRSAATVRKAG